MRRRTFLGRALAAGGVAVLGRIGGGCDDDRGATADIGGSNETVVTDVSVALDTSVVAGEVLPDTASSELPPEVCDPTTGDALGPFYEADAPAIVDLAGGLPGLPIAVSGVVRDEGCRPIAGALVEVWQADDAGEYHDDRLRASITVDAHGRWAFDSIMPGQYLQASGYRPAHIHYRVSAPGFRTLVTQLYFEGDPYLAPNDSCGTCGSDDEARIIALVPSGGRGRGTLDITLAR